MIRRLLRSRPIRLAAVAYFAAIQFGRACRFGWWAMGEWVAEGPISVARGAKEQR